jgi:hypothetical protein
VGLGLFATWAISDLEELLTMSRSSRDLIRRVPDAAPLPEPIRREGFSPAHVVTGIAMMGVVVGHRRGGRRAHAGPLTALPGRR